MLSAEIQIGRPAGRCATSGRELRAGEDFHSAIFETPGGLERKDYAAECWSGPPEGAICSFRTRISPAPRQQGVRIDENALLALFLSLADTGPGLRDNLRFVLTLMLMRKRLAKYERTVGGVASEVWEIRLMRDRTLHQVVNPQLDEAQIEEVTRELNSVLADFDGGGEDAPVGPAPAGSDEPVAGG